MKLIIIGFITGLLFGFLLQKARVVRYDKQLGALRLLDMTIIKFMASAVLVSMVGVYLLYDLGQVDLSIKTTIVGANVVGAILFGLGWGMLGYCPGTSLGALGEGRLDALWGILGMIAGAAVFAEAYPVLKNTVYTWGDYGKITLPQVMNINHWPVIIAFIIIGLLLFVWFERKGL